jgi:3-oxoacyl-[acyl-carrier protein] reductase
MLTDKNVLITGASGGIGEAIAQGFAEQGASLTLSGTRIAKLEELADKITKATNANINIIVAKLGEDGEAERLAKQAGKVDILINNAGINRDALAMRMKKPDWDSVLNINLTSAFLLTQALLRDMMKARWGRIINISSVVGLMGNPGQTNYVASKAGLIGFTKSLALEVANRGVTVNAIAPGFIATPMVDKLNDQQKQAINSRIPMQKMGIPQDIAQGCLYLANADYITGETLNINGGLLMA